MWKWIAVVILLIGAIVTVAYKQHYAREKYHAQSQADCIALANSPEEKHSCDKDAQSRKNYAPWGSELLTWPEVITTWCLIATLFVLAWQSNETRKAATASQRMTDHLITSERPWIVAYVLTPSIPNQGINKMISLSIQSVNHGKTPAFLVELANGAIILDANEKLPEEIPAYAESNVGKWEGNGMMLAPEQNGIRNLDVFIPQPVLLHTAAKALWIHGYVKYRDAAGDSHEVGYCFRWNPGITDPQLSHFTTEGPPQYYRNT